MLSRNMTDLSVTCQHPQPSRACNRERLLERCQWQTSSCNRTNDDMYMSDGMQPHCREALGRCPVGEVAMDGIDLWRDCYQGQRSGTEVRCVSGASVSRFLFAKSSPIGWSGWLSEMHSLGGKSLIPWDVVVEKRRRNREKQYSEGRKNQGRNSKKRSPGMP